jgi:2-haloacid dehalogenase
VPSRDHWRVNQRHRFAAAIFDLGGVLIDWDPRHLYRKLFPGDEEGMERFLAETVSAAWNRQMDSGRSFQEAIDELKADHPDRADLIQAYRDRWPEMLGEVDAGTAQILRELRGRGLRLFALSNWSAETFAIARGMFAAFDLFDDILVSGDARLLKPDPRLFEMACRRFGVSPAEVVFVDDIAANVDGARAIGLTAIQFTDSDSLRRELQELRIL